MRRNTNPECPVVKPGNPPYLEYVRSTVEQKRQKASNADGKGPKGRPELVYGSKFVEGWEPSGVPVSWRDTATTISDDILLIAS